MARRFLLALVAILLATAGAVNGSGGDAYDRLLARIEALEGSGRLLREEVTRLNREAIRSRRLSSVAYDEEDARRLDPGSLAGVVGTRGAQGASRIPDLGQPLMARLRDDASLTGLSTGRVDTFDGYANALVDPTFERTSMTQTTIGTAYTAYGSAWEAKYVLNSGTVASTRHFSRVGFRNHAGQAFQSSAILKLTLGFGANAADMTIYLRPVNALNISSLLNLLPSWLVGSLRIWPQTVDNVTVSAYLEIVDGSDSVLAAGDPADLAELVDISEHVRLEAAYEGPAVSTDYRWRLRIDVTKGSGAGTLELKMGEPLMSGSEDGSVPAFTPSVGAWIPAFSGARFYRASVQVVSDVTDEDLVFNVGGGTGTKVYDTDNYHDDANAGRFTVPVSGVYHIDAGAEWEADTNGIRQLWLEINGAATIYARVKELNPIAGSTAHTQTSTDLQLSAGDYVTARVRQNTGVGLDIQSGRSSFLDIRLVGVGQW